MALLAFNNVGLRRGGTWSLWDVSLEVEPGELICVFGRSGSGKTSLSRIAAGLQTATAGSVSMVRGRPGGTNRPAVSLARECPAFAPELTAYENLDVFAALWGVRRRKRAKLITALLELTGLSDCRSAPVAALNLGALRLLEIARALLADCPVVIIDSLLDGVDAGTFERLWSHLLTLRRSEERSVIVTTSSSRVAGAAERVIVLHRGCVMFDGHPDALRRLAGEDIVVLGDVSDPAARRQIRERFSVTVSEEDGFLSFRTTGGERLAEELLAEFGSEVSCVYMKRPTLDDALDAIAGGSPQVCTRTPGEARQS